MAAANITKIHSSIRLFAKVLHRQDVFFVILFSPHSNTQLMKTVRPYAVGMVVGWHIFFSSHYSLLSFRTFALVMIVCLNTILELIQYEKWAIKKNRNNILALWHFIRRTVRLADAFHYYHTSYRFHFGSLKRYLPFHFTCDNISPGNFIRMKSPPITNRMAATTSAKEKKADDSSNEEEPKWKNQQNKYKFTDAFHSCLLEATKTAPKHNAKHKPNTHWKRKQQTTYNLCIGFSTFSALRLAKSWKEKNNNDNSKRWRVRGKWQESKHRVLCKLIACMVYTTHTVVQVYSASQFKHLWQT